jgi:glyceraldehyde 3-phosphate dehydrogenase
VKLYAWYDNEYGYACRTAELAAKVGKATGVESNKE